MTAVIIFWMYIAGATLPDGRIIVTKQEGFTSRAECEAFAKTNEAPGIVSRCLLQAPHSEA